MPIRQKPPETHLWTTKLGLLLAASESAPQGRPPPG